MTCRSEISKFRANLCSSSWNRAILCQTSPPQWQLSKSVPLRPGRKSSDFQSHRDLRPPQNGACWFSNGYCKWLPRASFNGVLTASENSQTPTSGQQQTTTNISVFLKTVEGGRKKSGKITSSYGKYPISAGFLPSTVWKLPILRATYEPPGLPFEKTVFWHRQSHNSEKWTADILFAIDLKQNSANKRTEGL